MKNIMSTIIKIKYIITNIHATLIYPITWNVKFIDGDKYIF